MRSGSCLLIGCSPSSFSSKMLSQTGQTLLQVLKPGLSPNGIMQFAVGSSLSLVGFGYCESMTAKEEQACAECWLNGGCVTTPTPGAVSYDIRFLFLFL